jgi:hypothetical protein
LKETNRRMGYSILSSEAITFTIQESYAQMKFAGCTINQMGVIDTFNRHMKGIHNYPTQFVKRLSAFEKLCMCPK